MFLVIFIISTQIAPTGCLSINTHILSKGFHFSNFTHYLPRAIIKFASLSRCCAFRLTFLMFVYMLHCVMCCSATKVLSSELGLRSEIHISLSTGVAVDISGQTSICKHSLDGWKKSVSCHVSFVFNTCGNTKSVTIFNLRWIAQFCCYNHHGNQTKLLRTN